MHKQKIESNIYTFVKRQIRFSLRWKNMNQKQKTGAGVRGKLLTLHLGFVIILEPEEDRSPFPNQAGKQWDYSVAFIK